MSENWLKMKISNETISAVFIIVIVSFFILANFTIGFVFPLYALAMGLSFLIAIFLPRAGIYAVIFLTIIFERFFTLQTLIFEKGEYKLYPIDILLAGIFIGTVFELLSQKISIGSDHPEFIEKDGQRKPYSFELKRPDFYLIGFMLSVAIYFIAGVSIFKTDFALAFSSFKNYVFYSILFFLVAILINKEKHIKRLFEFFLAGALFLITFIIYGLAMRHGLWSDYTPLSTEGIRTLAFTHAFYLGLGFLGLLTYLVFRKEKPRVWHYALMVIWSLGIVGSMMRHLWGGIAVATLALGLILLKNKMPRLKEMLITYGAVFIFSTVVIFYLAALFPNSSFSDSADFARFIIGKRIGSVLNASQDESFSWRNMVWKEGFAEYSNSPILGLGLGKRMYVESPDYRDFVEIRNIHNSLLVLLFQFGIAPLLLFLAFVWGNLKSILKKSVKNWIDVALLSTIVYYFVIFLFQPYLETNLLGIFFWIIMGLFAAKSRNDFLTLSFRKSR